MPILFYPFYPKGNLDLLDANSTVSTFTHPRVFVFIPETCAKE